MDQAILFILFFLFLLLLCFMRCYSRKYKKRGNPQTKTENKMTKFKISASYFSGKANNNTPSDLPLLEQDLDSWKGDYLDLDEEDEIKEDFATWEAFKAILEKA